MWEALQPILVSQSPWSSFFYLILGAILGAVLSIYLTFKAQRPRLIVSGGGGGGNQQGQRWSLSVLNRPSFFGLPFAGETARDVRPLLKLRERDSKFYPLQWSTQASEHQITLEPGQAGSINLFSWTSGTRGYCVLDQTGEPVARFEARELKFVLRLNDRLGRMTEITLTVKFDDSHLKNAPQLQIVQPLSIEARRHMAMKAVKQFIGAFRAQR